MSPWFHVYVKSKKKKKKRANIAKQSYRYKESTGGWKGDGGKRKISEGDEEV